LGEIALLATDRQRAQGGISQQAQCRDALEQGDIIFNRHEGPVTRFANCESLAESYHGTSL
jgi:hypothetical protein